MSWKRRGVLRGSAAIAIAMALLAREVPSSAAGAHHDPRLITVRSNNSPVRSVLLSIAARYHISISIDPRASGYVTCDLRDVSIDNALRAIVEPVGMNVRRQGDVYLVSATQDQQPVSGQTSERIEPAVLPVTVLKAERAAHVIRALFPQAMVAISSSSNALIVTASPRDTDNIRSVLSGIDIKDPGLASTEALTLHTPTSTTVAAQLHGLYPQAQFLATSKSQIVVRALPTELAQIKTLVTSLDTSPPAAPPVQYATDAVHVVQSSPVTVARAVAHQFRAVRFAISGSSIIMNGPQDDITRAKALIALIDAPGYGDRLTKIYRLHNVDATSVADLIGRSFSDVTVSVDHDLNAVSIAGTATEQARIDVAISQLDSDSTLPAGSAAANGPTAGSRDSNFEVIQLQSIIPGASQGTASTTSADIANAVQQALQGSASEVHVSALNGSSTLMLTGSTIGIREAKRIIAALDVIPDSVALDTEIFEVDENGSKDLGLLLPSASVGTTFSEMAPTADSTTGAVPKLIGLQPISRTQLSLEVQLNLLVQKGNARILANPRITTISGRTATIRSGDTLGILTTVGGGAGTTTTSQLQTFQTGVTLDITLVVTAEGDITVSLHPVVNSLSGILNGVPEISTRDAQTTVHVRNNEMLAIGGLIQESSQRTENRIPGLGDLPLVGSLFRNTQTSNTKNELVIVVTPHLLATKPRSAQPEANIEPQPRPALPTIPPGTMLPNPMRKVIPASRLRTVELSASKKATDPLTTTPSPLPSDLAQANVFTYGNPPSNTYAAPNDAMHIFYARLSPTVVKPGSPVNVTVITTTNVEHVDIGPPGFAVRLSSLGGGKWMASYIFNTLGLATDQANVQLPIVAARPDGTQTTIQIPLSVTQAP